MKKQPGTKVKKFRLLGRGKRTRTGQYSRRGPGTTTHGRRTAGYYKKGEDI